jgi:hypothetical protein
MKAHRGWTRFRKLRAAGLAALLALVALSGSAWGADTPKQSPREADQALQDLMKKRRAVQGKTFRGQSVADARPFKVTPRKPALSVYPCTNCHDNTFVDPRVRQLKDEHTALEFDHGGGRIWCYDACHNGRDMDRLVSLRHRAIDYDEPFKLCGQCHFQKQKDWAFGGHGRRAGAWPVPAAVPLGREQLRVMEREKIGTWRGPREVLACPACHNPHSPSIKPYKPSPPPTVRTGLTRSENQSETHPPLWELYGRTAAEHARPAPPSANPAPGVKPGANPGGKP